MNDNVREYLEGLLPIADNLEKLIAGSNLSHGELGALAYMQGYLRAAKSHLDAGIVGDVILDDGPAE